MDPPTTVPWRPGLVAMFTPDGELVGGGDPRGGWVVFARVAAAHRVAIARALRDWSYHAQRCTVLEGLAQGDRLARWLGFRPTGEVIEIFDERLVWYERGEVKR